MRIGLTGGASSVERMVEQAEQAEADGFSSLWFASAVGGDPLVAMALAGRATRRSSSAPRCCRPTPAIRSSRPTGPRRSPPAMGRAGFTLGLGPSHQPVDRGRLRALLRDAGAAHGGVRARAGAAPPRETVEHHGDEFDVVLEGRVSPPPHPVSLMISALAPADAAGRRCSSPTAPSSGWPTPAPSSPTWRPASARPRPTPVGPRRASSCGLPIAVADDAGEARDVAATVFAGYGELPNYRRVLDIGGADGPGDAAIVGDEASVTTQIAALAEAGVTDFWAAPFPVGADRKDEPAANQRPVDVTAPSDHALTTRHRHRLVSTGRC